MSSKKALAGLAFGVLLVLLVRHEMGRRTAIQDIVNEQQTTDEREQQSPEEPERVSRSGVDSTKSNDYQKPLTLTKQDADTLAKGLAGRNVKVARVIDGDTIDVELPANMPLSGRVRIRYGGIDATERGAAYSKKARDKNCELVEGKSVALQFDKTYHDAKYGRLVAYVFASNPDPASSQMIFVNVELVRAGLACVSIYDENDAHAADLVKAQRAARAEKLGLWQVEKQGNEKVYYADRTRWRFHRPGCEWAKKIPGENLVKYGSRGEAFDEGKSPCSTCKP